MRQLVQLPSKLLFLLLLCVVIIIVVLDNTTTFVVAQQQSNRSCDELIGIVSSDEIREVVKLYMEPYFDVTTDDGKSSLQTSTEVTAGPVQYDIAVYKLCTSCSDIDLWYLQDVKKLLPTYHTYNYCNTTRPYYGTQLSFLVMIPLEEDDDDVDENRFLTQTKLRVYLSLPPTRLDYDLAPTVFFPSSITETFLSSSTTSPNNTNTTTTRRYHRRMQNATANATDTNSALSSNATSSTANTTTANTTSTSNTTADEGKDDDTMDSDPLRILIVDYLPTMIAASAGAIGIIPDYVGYGESITTAARSVLVKDYYEQVSALGYLKTKKWLNETTLSCTMLDDSAITITGLDDGAYGAIYVAENMRLFDLQITTLFLGGGVYDVETFWSDAIIQAFDRGVSNPRLRDMYQLSTFSYRNEGATSDQYNASLMEKYSYPGNTEIELPMGPNTTDIMNSDLVALLRYPPVDDDYTVCESYLDATVVWSDVLNNTDLNASSVVLVSNYFQGVCESLRSGSSTWDLINTAFSREWTYPISMCYSDSDEVYTRDQFIGFNITDDLEESKEYIRFDGPGIPELSIQSDSSHEESLELCILHPILFLALQEFKPSLEENEIDYQIPFDEAESATCVKNDPSAAAYPPDTKAPTPAPVEGSNNDAPDEPEPDNGATVGDSDNESTTTGGDNNGINDSIGRPGGDDNNVNNENSSGGGDGGTGTDNTNNNNSDNSGNSNPSNKSMAVRNTSSYQHQYYGMFSALLWLFVVM